MDDIEADKGLIL